MNEDDEQCYIVGLQVKRIEELEALLDSCVKDMYSQSGKISKSTAIELMKYKYPNKVLIVNKP